MTITTTPPRTRSPWSGVASAAESERWLAVAQSVADELAKDAVARDRANTPPVEQLALLRESGLANLLVPAQAGGHGGHWETAFGVARVLARADASIAQILGYHYLNQACVVFYGTDPARQAEWLRRSAEGSWVWSDSFNPVSPDLAFTADGDGYRLSGVKRFATGASVADVIIAGAVAEGGALDGRLVVFAIEGDRPGIEHPGDWDNVGYRASASGSVRYTDVAVSPDDIIGVDEDEPFSSVVTPGVQLLFGNIYLGIAEGALAQARELTRARPGSWFLSGVDRYSDDPVTHRLFGELVARTVAVEALADRLNRRYDEAVALGAATTSDDRAALEIAVAQLKVIATEVGLDVSSRVFEATGASSTRAAVGLDRHWRDIRTHSLHDPVDYKKIEVGAHYLNGTIQPVSLYT
ncbi:alkylation response protein AidB-like acyl-CoA dehydrogenase [Homoserinimonas aerilata]|uniref:Dibenzothiophene monooxygenase n=1 Tax=Homoserinimonas aerilata TaxID=1162970 RepID=A0A542YF97_9MICO|nr:acyl-CoA dehydrogenase family protein [Homoserinimonas aerilata]TQL46747.1 alkylation response protein AidB-like acyl-CoA dehydrogenase [Homoserinimonas aerilata]